jgi:hypothetical protein
MDLFNDDDMYDDTHNGAPPAPEETEFTNSVLEHLKSLYNEGEGPFAVTNTGIPELRITGGIPRLAFGTGLMDTILDEFDDDNLLEQDKDLPWRPSARRVRAFTKVNKRAQERSKKAKAWKYSLARWKTRTN